MSYALLIRREAEVDLSKSKERHDTMFKKLALKLQALRIEETPFDPSTLGDSLAAQIEWTPVKRGGASFRTHRLVELAPHRLEFRASTGAIVFYSVFLLFGVGAIILSFLGPHKPGQPLEIIPFLFGLLFGGIGGCMLYFGTAPVVFDKQKGFFWKGRKTPNHIFDRDTIKHFAELEYIHAIQLISEKCSGDNRTYYSYELNLVLKDGRRINVVDHGNQAILKLDAERLSAFLKKPVWDAI